MAPDIIRLLLLLFVVSTSPLKYVYVEENYRWDAAQKYCRLHYTDLAPVNSEYDMSLLQQTAEKSSNTKATLWFGLMRNKTDLNKWMWSGGGEMTLSKDFWEEGQPDSLTTGFGLLINFKWHDASIGFSITHFLCYKVHVETERMTWEEALEFCRVKYEDLASVASETEMMLMRQELLKHNYTTEYVWVGLSFLSDVWMWVDGQPLAYEAWGPNEQPWCPAMRCGALKVTGTLEESLDGKMVHAGNIKEWNSRDCHEKLHFLCY